jgi:hypothetical protein
MRNKTANLYTIRGVPADIDGALRKRVAKEGKSLNAVVLDALRTGSGASNTCVRSHDLDNLAGTWVVDPVFDKAMEAFEAIDKDLWK